MDSRKLVFRETAVVAIGQVICVAAMIGIYALLGAYSCAVLLGGIFGGILAVLNFFFMAISAMIAADKAERQNVAGGKLTVQLSFIVRTAVLFVVLFALIKSGLCDTLASVLPLVFTRPIISVGEFFRKSGESKV
ncbi:MAG: ATP synthase subunit I [Oscillospiraceae bacterium]|nr:ATP synthase subunit I [Oscillospiraceae bacterium]